IWPGCRCAGSRTSRRHCGGRGVSPPTVSDLNKKIYGTIEAWRNRPIEGQHPYVYLDGIVLKRSGAGEVRNVSLLVAIGVNESGYREIVGICEGAKEDKSGWSEFLKHLKDRGLKGIRLITSDACIGLAESAAEFFPVRPGKGASCTGTATSSVTCPRPRCGRSRPCLRRSMPARTSRRHARRLSEWSRSCVACAWPGPPSWWKQQSRRHSPTTPSRRSIGGGFAPTTRSSASCVDPAAHACGGRIP